MSERDTDSIESLVDKLPSEQEPKVAAASPAPVIKVGLPQLVELNYPDPTLLSVVIRDVARWSRLSFVMEPTVNTKIQIFAPRKLTPAEAYDLFLASLAVVCLRAVQVGSVVKIVPVTLSVSA